MAKKINFRILVMVLVFGMTVSGCDNGSDLTENLPQTVKYESRDSDGTTYILTITSTQSGDSYKLKILPSTGEQK
ncbi:MAG: hypothetical protein FWH41_01720 [Treponema sp.]|nr:hypothetical protein [Treponema sp.]